MLKSCVLLLSSLVIAVTSHGSPPPPAPIEEPPAEKPAERKPSTRLERTFTSPGVVTTRQNITPAGVAAIFHGRISAAIFGETEDDVWVLVDRPNVLQRVHWSANQLVSTMRLPGGPGIRGLAWDESGKQLLVVRNSPSPAHPKPGDASIGLTEQVDLVAVANGNERVIAPGLGFGVAGAPVVAQEPPPGSPRRALVPLTRDDRLAVVDASSGKVLARIDTGVAPSAAAMNRAGTVAYVSNWGGRMPRPGDVTATRGTRFDADPVVIQDRGMTATGTVARVNLATADVTDVIAVGLHPASVLWDEERSRVYVGNGESDSVSVIDSGTNRVIKTIPLQPFDHPVPGVSPTALALSPDGGRLFVACGGINAVVVIDTASGGTVGALPTAWYPCALDLSADGKRLLVSTQLGVGSDIEEGSLVRKFVHSYRGTVHLIDLAESLSPERLNAFTQAVAMNNHMRVPALPPRSDSSARAVPERVGEPSLIEHVVYIIKENRTYDQVLGDIGRANGDASLAIYGRKLTPNHHKLAEEFVTLDNFYATGGSSGDGHQWVTQASEADYAMLSGYAGRSYPFDGSDPLAIAASGFLWDAALARGRTVRVYGEYAPNSKLKEFDRTNLLERWKAGETFDHEFVARSPIPALNRILAPDYPTYSLDIPDVVRARILLRDLKSWEAAGAMPNLVFVQLPCDHTRGTAAGKSRPSAMLADNDLALGQIVQALSTSTFWKKMAIFVVEDDAQGGVDHVDGHRTVALAVSPYTRRGIVDSTFYSQPSIVRTIGLMLGTPPLSLFDLIATDMRNCFRDEPDLTPYQLVQPEASLFDLNPKLGALNGEARRGAIASARMRWDIPDAVPSEKLNRILWHEARGWQTKYPGVHQAAFAPFSLGDDEEDDD